MIPIRKNIGCMIPPPRIEAIEIALDVCALLRERGCTILAASAINGTPRVTVDRPVPGLRAGHKISAPRYGYAVMASRMGPVQVEWRAPR